MRTLLLSCALALGFAACQEDTLSGQICRPGEIECNEDGTYRSCSITGAAWNEGVCPLGQKCVTATCGGANVFEEHACRDIVCSLGDRRCNPADNMRIEVCDDTGTDWCCVGSCATPEVDGVCFEGSCVPVCEVGEKSYLGCDYFAVDLDNAFVPCGTDDNGQLIFCDAAGSQFSVVLSNPDNQGKVVYQISSGPPQLSEAKLCEPLEHVVAAGVLPPKGYETIDLPRHDVNGTVKATRGYRIATNAPITAYQFNPLDNVDVFSNDASLLLPTNTAGKKYLVMTREQTFDDLKGYLTVVGTTQEPASVTVQVTTRTFPGLDMHTGETIPALEPGDTYTTTLGRYDVLNIETNYIGGDLTGSLVTSTEPVIVFGGSEAANAPNTSRCDLETMTCEWDGETPCECTEADGPLCSPHQKCSEFITCCADHLEQQLFPLEAWGSEYLAIRSMQRGTIESPGKEKDVWRILAASDNTEVTLQPDFHTIPTLDAGEWYELETNEDFLITSNFPILVGQFLAAEQAPEPGTQDGDARTGDPAFILAVPVRQFRDSYVFLVPSKYLDDYISVAARDGDTPRLDGRVIENLSPDVHKLRVNPIAGTEWRAIRVRIDDNYHILSCTQGCSVMVHGYDQYVSYGYPGGLNLEEEEEEEEENP